MRPSLRRFWSFGQLASLVTGLSTPAPGAAHRHQSAIWPDRAPPRAGEAAGDRGLPPRAPRRHRPWIEQQASMFLWCNLLDGIDAVCREHCVGGFGTVRLVEPRAWMRMPSSPEPLRCSGRKRKPRAGLMIRTVCWPTLRRGPCCVRLSGRARVLTALGRIKYGVFS